MKLIVIGAPRTKKGHTKIVKVRGVTRIVQSDAHDAWAEPAILQMQAAHRRMGPAFPAYAMPVNLNAQIYRDRETGDLNNYLGAIADALERAGVVVNDKWIRGHDGSRLHVDAKNPRIELELTPLDG
jgi:Holliday junction resolvase RusA-like endonuclease